MDVIVVVSALIAAGLLICISAFLANEASNAAEAKGYPRRKWFHMCFWLGPLSYLILFAMPDQIARKQLDEMIALQKAHLERGSVARAGFVLDEETEAVPDVPASEEPSVPVPEAEAPTEATAPLAEQPAPPAEEAFDDLPIL